MKEVSDTTFKWLSKFFITLGVIYWVCLILAATGCQTYEYDIKNKSHKTFHYNPNETTISLDPMDKTQWHEREQFLRQLDY